MGRVLTSGQFSVFVYAEWGQPHHLPHCDVRWQDGRSTQVALPTLMVIVGPPLSRTARQLLEDHLIDLVEAWNRNNPKRAIV